VGRLTLGIAERKKYRGGQIGSGLWFFLKLYVKGPTTHYLETPLDRPESANNKIKITYFEYLTKKPENRELLIFLGHE
jgi:hypothetical protein